jgi:hypothetical protein
MSRLPAAKRNKKESALATCSVLFRRSNACLAADDGPGNPTVDFHRERRSNDPHQSKIRPDSRLAKKTRSSEAKLAYTSATLSRSA